MSRRSSVALLAIALALSVSWSGVASAQEAPQFQVTATLQPRAATLGEHVRLTVIVHHATDLLITASEPARVSNIELVAVEPETVTFQEDRSGATTTYVFVLTAFQLGDLHPGRVEVAWLRADGSAGSSVVSPPILRITPVRVEGDDALRPLKPQAVVGGAPAWWQRTELPTGLALLLLTLAAASWWWRRRARTIAAPVSAPTGASAEDRARARLDRLQGAALADRAVYQHFYGEISLVTREYLAERYEFNATALTTAELDQAAEDAGIGRWQARLATGLLQRCDAAVYARSRPDPASADHDLTVAYEVVELSRPRYHGEQLDEAASA
ncbi:MAG: hypothetical protein HOH95_10255 [Dehalococcoidia bacterium]|jgi:hypothetical protein|nr:hypothetical protein [Dehalococcoidia bacterium]